MYSLYLKRTTSHMLGVHPKKPTMNLQTEAHDKLNSYNPVVITIWPKLSRQLVFGQWCKVLLLNASGIESIESI